MKYTIQLKYRNISLLREGLIPSNMDHPIHYGSPHPVWITPSIMGTRYFLSIYVSNIKQDAGSAEYFVLLTDTPFSLHNEPKMTRNTHSFWENYLKNYLTMYTIKN